MTCFDSIDALSLWRIGDVLFVQNVCQDILGSTVAENVVDTV